MEPTEENNRRILFAAAWRGEEDKLKSLIDSGAVPINAVDENKVTALRFTAQYGHEELTRFLLEKGADPNLKVTFVSFLMKRFDKVRLRLKEYRVVKVN